MHKRALVWLRRDLRAQDHRAWAEAEIAADSVAAVFVFDHRILDHLEKDDRRITFIHDSLSELKTVLESKGSTLIIRHGDPLQEIPKLARALKADAVFTNRDYEPYARDRDAKVQAKLGEDEIAFYSFKDHVIFESEEVKNKTGNYFKVFTPYAKTWRAKLSAQDMAEAKVRLKNLASAHELKKYSQDLSLEQLGFSRQELFIEAGRKGALAQLETFKKHVTRYKDQRDFPALDATSRLSTHLRFGTLNVRELLRTTPGEDVGTATWHSELIWREFYQMLLTVNPQLPKKCFQPKCDAIEWPGTREHFKKWCEGQTGYPLIDATLRHFNKTGWMHNRLRMVVASFLTKDLLCDWRWGEKYFAQHLLDFELASNNGGWQWAASVGCDAQPYFRVFNPILQSERFDEKGEFIRQEIPELARVPDKYIHAPWLAKPEMLAAWGVKIGKDYPHPIVDHATQKDRAIRLFKT